MSYEDEKIVSISFDNSRFHDKVKETLKDLLHLEQSLNVDTSKAASQFDALTEACGDSTEALNYMEGAVQEVRVAFSALQIIGMTVLSDLTRSAMQFGKRIYANTVGQIISGGTARSANIENAKFQLEGLGVAWKQIQDDLDYGVKDTAYGLDSAAKAAAQFVASNVSIGDDMKTALRAISGVASMTNSTYDDIANIFTRVSGTGRLMGQDLQSLAARGLNAAAIIAKNADLIDESFNGTEEAVRKLVSQGKISFKEFAAIMDKEFGEHAKQANATYSGSLANMKAALSKIGVLFIDPLRNAERDLFYNLKLFFDKVKSQLGPIVNLWTGMVNKVFGMANGLLQNEKALSAVVQLISTLSSILKGLYVGVYDFLLQRGSVDDFFESITNFLKRFELEGDNLDAFAQLVSSILSLVDVLGIALRETVNILDVFFDALFGTQAEMEEVGSTNEKVAITMRRLSVILTKVGLLLRLIILCVSEIIKFALPKVINTIKFALSGIIALLSMPAMLLQGIKTAAENVGIAFHNLKVKVTNAMSNLTEKARLLFSTFSDGIDGIKTDMSDSISNIEITFSDFLSRVSEKAKTVKPDWFGSTKLKEDLEASEKAATNTAETINKIQNEPAKVHATGSSVVLGAFGTDLASTLDRDAIKAKLQQDDSDIVEELKATNRSVNDTLHSADRGSSKTKSKGMWATLVDVLNTSAATVEDAGASFGDRVNATFAKLKDAVTNPWNIMGGILASVTAVTAVVGSVFTFELMETIFALDDVLLSLGKTLRGMASAMNKYGTALILKQLPFVFLSLAALIGVIAVVATYCDLDALKRISIWVVALGAAITTFVAVISAINAVTSLANVIAVLNNTDISPIGKVRLLTNSISQFFVNLAILLGAILSGTIIIMGLSHHFGWRSVLASGLYVMAVLAATTLMVRLVLSGVTMADKTYKVFNLKTASFTSSATLTYSSIARILIAYSAMIGVVAAATYLLKDEDPIKVLATAATLFVGTTAMMLAATLSINTIMSSLIVVNKSGQHLTPVSVERTFAQLTRMYATIFLGMAGMMLVFAFAASRLGKLSSGQFKQGVFATLALMTFMTGAVVAMTTAAQKLSLATNKKGLGTVTEGNAKRLMAVATILRAFSTAMLFLTASVAALAFIPTGNLVRGVAALTVVLGVVTAITAVLSMIVGDMTLGKFSVTTGAENVINSKTRHIAILLGALSAFVFTLAGAIATIALVGDIGKLNASVDMFVKLLEVTFGGLALILAITTQFGIYKGADGILNEGIQNYAGVVAIISVLSGLVTILAGSLKVVSGIGASELLRSTIAFIALIGVMEFTIASLMTSVTLIDWMTNRLNKNHSLANNMTANMQSLMAIIGVVSAMATVLTGLTYVLSTIDDPKMLWTAVGALSVLMVAFSTIVSSFVGMSAMISKMHLGPSILQLIIMMGALSTLSLAMASSAAIFAYALTSAEWDKLSNEAIAALAGFGIVCVAISALAVVAGIVATKAPIVLAGFAAVAAIFGAIGFVNLSFAAVINALVDGIGKISSVIHAIASAPAEKFKMVMLDIASGFAELGKHGWAILLLGILSPAIKGFAEGLDTLSKISGKDLVEFAKGFGDFVVTFAASLKNFSTVQGTFYGIVAAFVLFGAIIAIELATIATAFTIVAASVVAILIAAIAASLLMYEFSGIMAEGIQRFIASFAALKDSLSEDLLNRFKDVGEALAGATVGYAKFGILLAIAGLGMLAGALGFLGAIAIMRIAMIELGKVANIMLNSFEDLALAVAQLGSVGAMLILLGIVLDAVALFLPAGAVAFAGAAGLLWLAAWEMTKACVIITSGYDTMTLGVAQLGAVATELLLLGIVLDGVSLVLPAGAVAFAGAAGLLWLAAWEMGKACAIITSKYDIMTLGVAQLGAVATELLLLGIVLDGVSLVLPAGAVAFAGSMLLLKWAIGALKETTDMLADSDKYFLAVDDLFALSTGLGGVGTVMSTVGMQLVKGSLMFYIGASAMKNGIYALSDSISVFEEIDVDGFSIRLNTLGRVITIYSANVGTGMKFVTTATSTAVGCVILAKGLDALNPSLERFGTVAVQAVDQMSKMQAIFESLSLDVINGFVEGMEKASTAPMFATITRLAEDCQRAWNIAWDINSPSVWMYNSAGYVVEGFVLGLEDNGSEAIVTMSNLASKILEAFRAVLGIHSPATEAFNAAAYWIAGWVGGIVGNASKATNTTATLGENSKISFLNSLSGTGTSAMANLISEMQSSGGAMAEMGSILGQLFAGSMQAEIDKLQWDKWNLITEYSNTAAVSAYDSKNYYDEKYKGSHVDLKDVYGYAQANKDALGLSSTAIQNMPDWALSKIVNEYSAEQAAATAEELAGKLAEIDSLINTLSGVETPTEDLQDYTPIDMDLGGGGGSYSDLGSSGGRDRTTSLANTTSGNVGNTVTNNTYNFVQNNYSPEPIDRTELYVQTNRQFEEFYKAFRT